MSSTSHFGRVADTFGTEAFGWVLAVNGVLLVGWGIHKTLESAARKRAAWREAGPLAGASFEARLAARLKEIDDPDARPGA